MKIQLQQLSKSFGEKVAVDIPQLEIGDGEIIGLVGNNGAGKTTLFRLLLDLLRADSGSVLLTPQNRAQSSESARSFLTSQPLQTSLSDHASRPLETPQSASPSDVSRVSIDPAKSEEWKKMTGAFIDDTFLIDFLSVEEYLDFIIKVQGLTPMDWNGSDDPLVQGFKEFAEGQIFDQKKLIREYSAGNKQKIGIMAAMISRPELLILDEPFNFLDPTGQNFLKKLLLDYHCRTGATILISSHNLQHLVDVSTRVVLLEDGKVIEDLANDNRQALTALNDYFKV
ncbi:ATP-binding cassette domain-containing protein [Hallella absiana]|uniref:ATP-binding cassette domain-containing protein n=1 Tax=Hallella absiana TaxID=2925336 RepID=UPI0021C97296|nr:ATP-binding cassette domain-containing protein [Hallella absiana]